MLWLHVSLIDRGAGASGTIYLLYSRLYTNILYIRDPPPLQQGWREYAAHSPLLHNFGFQTLRITITIKHTVILYLWHVIVWYIGFGCILTKHKIIFLFFHWYQNKFKHNTIFFYISIFLLIGCCKNGLEDNFYMWE